MCFCHLSQSLYRSSPFNQSCRVLWSTRVALFWPIRTVLFGPIKLQGFGVFICMRTGQSGIRGQGLLSVSGSESVLSLSMEDWRLCFPRWAEILRMSCQNRMERISTGQGRLAQNKADHRGPGHSYLAREGPGQRAASQLFCFHSRAVPQLSCSTAVLFS